MKDFIKWLGVNEKIAKVVVWLFIIMIFLILTNTLLDSLGFYHYKITYDNLKNINYGEAINTFSQCIVCILNFYATILLIFKAKESKKFFKFSILYMILNWIITVSLGYIASQIYILVFFVLFAYIHSNKNWKYILYIVGALIFNTIIQGICYYYKASLIDITQISRYTRSLLSIDYFIIMGIIILVKEIYLKKRGERLWVDPKAGSGGANSTKKTNLPKKSPKK